MVGVPDAHRQTVASREQAGSANPLKVNLRGWAGYAGVTTVNLLIAVASPRNIWLAATVAATAFFVLGVASALQLVEPTSRLRVVAPWVLILVAVASVIVAALGFATHPTVLWAVVWVAGALAITASIAHTQPGMWYTYLLGVGGILLASGFISNGLETIRSGKGNGWYTLIAGVAFIIEYLAILVPTKRSDRVMRLSAGVAFLSMTVGVLLTVWDSPSSRTFPLILLVIVVGVYALGLSAFMLWSGVRGDVRLPAQEDYPTSFWFLAFTTSVPIVVLGVVYLWEGKPVFSGVGMILLAVALFTLSVRNLGWLAKVRKLWSWLTENR